jgi:hypothetical protein
MRHGAVTAFLARSSVHGDLPAHVIARANAIRKFLRMIRAAGSQQAWISLQSEFSNNEVENGALLSKRLRRDISSKHTALALCGM